MKIGETTSCAFNGGNYQFRYAKETTSEGTYKRAAIVRHYVHAGGIAIISWTGPDASDALAELKKHFERYSTSAALEMLWQTHCRKALGF